MLKEPSQVRRHDLVRLAPAGWDQALAGLSGPAAALAAGWRARDLPAVVRRTEPGTPPDAICLGMPGPPDPGTGQKLRVGFAVLQRHVASLRAPLALDEAEAPPAWQPAFDALRDAMRGAGVECRVFGSLAMQALTGEPYLRPGSDIDLLLRPKSVAQLDAGLALLARFARRLPLDGEIEFPSGHAVSWKEWLPGSSGADRVLAKHIDTVALLRRDALLSQFGGQAHG
jgi:phosphoribosyl-dephospho-CoA transferase